MAKNSRKRKKPELFVQVSMVDDTRLELVTSRTSSGCATSCANRPSLCQLGHFTLYLPDCQAFFRSGIENLFLSGPSESVHNPAARSVLLCLCNYFVLFCSWKLLYFSFIPFFIQKLFKNIMKKVDINYLLCYFWYTGYIL